MTLNLPKLPATAVVAIDWETSGRNITHMSDNGSKEDHSFGFGLSVGYLDPITKTPIIVGQTSVAIWPFGEVPSDGGQWHDLWTRSGWDQECFEFWSGRRSLDNSESHAFWIGGDTSVVPGYLKLLANFVSGKTSVVAKSFKEAADQLNLLLTAVEAASPDGGYIMGWDCITFDPWLTNMLLCQNGYLPITHTRTGRFRWEGNIDEDSMEQKCFSLLPPKSDEDNQTHIDIVLDAETSANAACPDSGIHEPAWDAHVILYRILRSASLQWAARS